MLIYGHASVGRAGLIARVGIQLPLRDPKLLRELWLVPSDVLDEALAILAPNVDPSSASPSRKSDESESSTTTYKST